MASKVKLCYILDDGSTTPEFVFDRGADGNSSSKDTNLTKKIVMSASNYPIVTKTSYRRVTREITVVFKRAPLSDYDTFFEQFIESGDESLMRLTDWQGIKSSGYIKSVSSVTNYLHEGYVDYAFTFIVMDYNI